MARWRAFSASTLAASAILAAASARSAESMAAASARRAARQHRHHVAQLGLPREAPLRRDHMRIERHPQARARLRAGRARRVRLAVRG